MQSQVSLLEKGREEGNMAVKQHATLRALKMEEGTQLRNKKNNNNNIENFHKHWALLCAGCV